SISRVTARRYLEYLAATGILRKEIRYQKVGRPLIYYIKV
ncbi:MAG: transcriptional regulator, partial [Spirochaetia bacterium]|nr:transcriptional regulator [Spirochaetia bacterium]